jgi:hypothetical protein
MFAGGVPLVHGPMPLPIQHGIERFDLAEYPLKLTKQSVFLIMVLRVWRQKAATQEKGTVQLCPPSGQLVALGDRRYKVLALRVHIDF